MDGFLDTFILEDRLTVDVTEHFIKWDGELVCVDGYHIHVEKTQERKEERGQAFVRTKDYAYHVQRVVDGREVPVFRYDNVGDHTDDGHEDRHHLHRFDERGEKIVPILWVGAANWPSMGDVIEEVYALCYPDQSVRQ